MTIQEVQFTDKKWLDFWREFKGEPQQIEGVLKLGRHIRQSDPGLLTDSAEWVVDYRDKQPQPQGELSNLQSWLSYLTGPEVSRLSRSKISHLTLAEACGFIGCIVVETGRPLLDRLDVVEAGSGAGRGAMQYTGVRRIAYDKARSAAIAQGIDPASNAWQQRYFAEEYAGLHDPPQGSLIGWTRVFEDRPAGMDPARAAVYFSEVYFRPGVPHLERRQSEARRVWGLVQAGKLSAATSQLARTNPLQVPYYAQLDSATDQARRMCFSSSCAMLLAFLRPGLLHGPNGDDQYLARVRKFGDTTSAIAQGQALASYGIKVDFVKTADFALIERQINAGFPVPCGYLHRGPVSQPSGDGHWLIVVGYTVTHVIVHDPLGEADLKTGGTLDRPARFCHYSRKNFGRRWMVEGPGSGWAVIANR